MDIGKVLTFKSFSSWECILVSSTETMENVCESTIFALNEVEEREVLHDGKK